MSRETGLKTEIIDKDIDVLVPFIEASFGKRYRGDNYTKSYMRQVDRVIGLVDDTQGLAAAALIQTNSQNRIKAAVTSPDIERYGNRRQLMSKLLEGCHEDEQAAWMSMSNKHGRMHILAREAGMAMLEEESIIGSILEAAGLSNNYQIINDSSSRPLIVTLDGLSMGSIQTVWAWPDRLAEMQAGVSPSA